MMQASRLLPILLLAALVGCGGEDGVNGSTGPTVVTGVSVTAGSDLITINASQTLTARASLNNGSSMTVQPAWGSDAPGVATVDATGRVTGIGSGVATVFADYEGKRGTLLLRVVPNYQGRWEGDWSVTACSSDADWLDVCDEFRVGELFWLTLVVNQTRDTVTGTTDFGDELPGPVKGNIEMSGALVVGGTYTINVEGLLLELTVTDWETMSVDNQRMTGHLCVIGRVAGLQGSFDVDGELHVVTKVSSEPLDAGLGQPDRRGLLRAIRGRQGR
jgi:hypothetical protein